MKQSQRTWPHMRVRPTKFGGKAAADEKEELFSRLISGGVVPEPGSPVDVSYEMQPEPWETAKAGAKIGSLGSLIVSAIHAGRVHLSPGVRVPVIDPRAMQQLRDIAAELLSKMKEFIPYGRWHEVIETQSGGRSEITFHENFFALDYELENWNLSDSAWEFLESTNAYDYDRGTEQRRLSLSSLRRGFYGAIFRLERERVEKHKPKKADLEAQLWAALEGAK